MSRNFKEYVVKNLASRIAAQNARLAKLEHFAKENMCGICDRNVYARYGSGFCNECKTLLCYDCNNCTKVYKYQSIHYDYDGRIIISCKGKIPGTKTSSIICKKCASKHICADYKIDSIICTLCLDFKCTSCGKECRIYMDGCGHCSYEINPKETLCRTCAL
jgi:hypothetical protein